MLYALFSDIHSNLEAYEAVLAKIAAERPDAYCCIGDIVGYGADPTACIAKTRELNPLIVAGNHDWATVGLTDVNNFTANAKTAVSWTQNALSADDKEYLKGLKVEYKKAIAMVHGSPNNPEDFEYIFGLNQAHTAFLRMEEQDTRICFVGHTHAAGVFIANDEGDMFYNSWPEVKIEDNKRYIVNVGSVGQPRDGDPRAAYCVYDTENKVVRINRIKYDVGTAQEKIIKAGLPRILAERLTLGK